MSKSRAFAIEPSSSRKDDGLTQAERFKRVAQEMGLDEREETFDAALSKVARHRPPDASGPGQSPDYKPKVG